MFQLEEKKSIKCSETTKADPFKEVEVVQLVRISTGGSGHVT